MPTPLLQGSLGKYLVLSASLTGGLKKPSIHYRYVVTNYPQDLPCCVPSEEDIHSNALSFCRLGFLKIGTLFWKALKDVMPLDSEILFLYNETTSE